MATELGTFLRARRLQVSPDNPAYQPSERRRIKGLRREEVAAAAGISVDYYTRLEQGREASPSDSVVKALARALELDTDAIDHMRELRTTSVEAAPATAQSATMLAARMTALVAAVSPNPAYVLDRLSNVVAINPEGLALFDGLEDLPPQERNTCHYLFTHPRTREVFADWETIAWGSVAQLRAANASHLTDPHLVSMVDDLSAANEEFKRWWNEHEVAKRRSSATRLVALNGVVRRYQYEVLQLPDAGLRMSLYVTRQPTR